MLCHLKIICQEGFFFFECSGAAAKRKWILLKGKMEVSTAPVKALVYMEGPPTGVDIFASYCSIAPSKPEPVRLLFIVDSSFHGKFINRGCQSWLLDHCFFRRKFHL